MVSKVDKALQQAVAMYRDCTKMVKLWENANPASAFASQDISVDLSGYDIVAITHGTYTDGVMVTFVTDFSPVNQLDARVAALVYGAFCQSGTTMSTRGYGASRRYSRSGGALRFRDGTRTLELSTISDNKMCIPYRIYGMKV